jgi:hypothetical protein
VVALLVLGGGGRGGEERQQGRSGKEREADCEAVHAKIH